MNNLTFWLIVGPLVGFCIGWYRKQPILGAALGVLGVIGWIAIFVITSKGTNDTNAWTTVKNASYGQHLPQHLYFTWGNQNEGVAIDLPIRKIYLSQAGRGKWFDISEIKHFGINSKPASYEFYILTNNFQYPEFLWKFYATQFRYKTYPAFERALKVAGDFHSER